MSGPQMPSTRRPGGRVRLLRWWSRAALDVAAARLREILERWGGDWGLELRSLRAANATATTDPVPPSTATPIVPGVLLWPCPGEATAALHQLLFDAAPAEGGVEPTLASDVAGQAWRDLLGMLSPAWPTRSSSATDDDAAQGPWSGALHVHFVLAGSTGRCEFGLHIGPAPAASWCAAAAVDELGAAADRPPRVPLWTALSARRTRLAVTLSSVRLDLGSIQSLQVGDVIALPHALDEPLHVGVAAGGRGAPRPLCKGHLGRRGDRKVVELLPDVAASGGASRTLGTADPSPPTQGPR
jgi:hypothetical protein